MNDRTTSEIDNQIVHRWQAGQAMRGIARALQVSRWRVRRVLAAYQQAREAESSAPRHAALPQPLVTRGSQLDQFTARITQLLARYPNITATRMLEELSHEGYQGGYTILRQRLKQLRAAPTQPLTVRFETAPGAQAQMDWAVYDLEFTCEGRRRVNLFSYVLGYSRRQYLCFTERQDFETMVREHIKAFEHLQGVAATCLYDNMKVVVQRWEDDHPIYNTRFLAFATHYGYRPWACRPRRPETKGKVERPFLYVEKSLLNGRTFRSLAHLNEVTRWWLANHADVRLHRTTHQRPIDAHAEEQPRLVPLPARHYDTARVVYRLVSDEGLIVFDKNDYSVPWRLVGQLLPVRVTEIELYVYNQQIQQVACHTLIRGHVGQRSVDPAHRPPDDHAAQLGELQQRYAELGEIASRFLKGLLAKQRYGKRQAARVLALLGGYHQHDLVAAMERAVRYHAYSLTALERILTRQATPKSPWHALTDDDQARLARFTDNESSAPRPTADYQYLLSFTEQHPDDPDEGKRGHDTDTDPESPGDVEAADDDGSSRRDPA